jgi:hypothetical protein
MKGFVYLLLPVFMTCGLVAHASDSIPVDVFLLNGESLQATFIKQHHGLTVLRPYWGGPEIQVPSRYIHRIRFGSKKSPTFPHVVHMWNGDRIYGEIVSVNAGELVVNTAWSEALALKRPMIKRVVMGMDQRLMYRGPGPLNAWSRDSSRGMYSYGSDVFESSNGLVVRGNGQLSRKIPFSSEGVTLKMNLEFTMSHQSFSFQLDDIMGKRSSMAFTFSSRNIYYREQTGDKKGMVVPWRITMPSNWISSGEVEIYLTLDPKNRKCMLWHNGILIKEWDLTLPEKLSNKPVNFQLNLMTRTDDAFFRNIEVFKGVNFRANEIPDPEEGQVKSEQTVLRLINGDALSGWLTGVSDGLVHIKLTEKGAPIPIRLERVSQMEFPENPKELIRKKARDVKVATSREMDDLTVQIVRSNETSLVLQSEYWDGELEFPFVYLDSITFNPHVQFEFPKYNPVDPGDLDEVR